MAFFQCNYFSRKLNNSTTMNVILPQPEQLRSRSYPTLYLLHGYSEDYSVWQRKSSIERYVYGRNLAVVMPDAQKSFYTDFHGIDTGYRYWQFISEELLEITRYFFPLSHKREHTFVAGLSMGGYGAFKLALNMPKQFGAAASLSGCLDAVRLANNDTENNSEFKMLFGESKNVEKSQNDLFHVAAALHESGAASPRLYQCCGTEDFLFRDNVRFKEHIDGLGSFDLTYKQGPGDHNWQYWDREIENVINWLNPDALESCK